MMTEGAKTAVQEALRANSREDERGVDPGPARTRRLTGLASPANDKVSSNWSISSIFTKFHS